MNAPGALLIIDVQTGFDDPKWGRRNNPDAEQQIAKLLTVWRHQRWPVIHVQHMSQEADSPLRPGTAGNTIRHEARPVDGEVLFQKEVNSAFIGTRLERYLRDQRIASLVIVGLTTDHCVSTTTRMAANLGFDAIVIDDATATFERTGPDGAHHSAEQMHRLALASLHGEFARVMTSARLIADIHAQAMSRLS